MSRLKATILGHMVGDALGVPVEFKSREVLDKDPVKDMREYGTYGQPKGTWSDDSSMTLSLMESLLDGYDLKSQAEAFIDWKFKANWTPYDSVFDIGITTAGAINTLAKIIKNEEEDSLSVLRYGASEQDNGNGALMRVLPLYFYSKGMSKDDRFEMIWNSSALTHGHIRSALACLFYFFVLDGLENSSKEAAFESAQFEFKKFLEARNIADYERQQFDRLLSKDFAALYRSEIRSAGYVMHSIEASIWCLLNSSSYEECVLMAVNLGSDTDTTGAIAGGLAGFFYGLNSIPEYWRASLARLEEVEHLIDAFEGSLH